VDESLQVDGEPESSKILNKDVSVYVKSNMGYLGKNKIELINGKGSFYFRALDLEVDDEVKLKIGFKTFSNVTEQNIKVILGA
jgi:RNA binding exosome subunit